MQTILWDNAILIAALLAWAAAQMSKTLIESVRRGKLRLHYLIASGGMPSAHSALVTSLATVIGRSEGVHSAAFALAVILAGIVMYDAAGVRRAVSRHAEILNQVRAALFHGQPAAEHRLSELIGHTPAQVAAGGLLGVIVGLLVRC